MRAISGRHAGRMIDSYQPGCLAGQRSIWLPGVGSRLRPGAKLARPRRQVVLKGDGAFGLFSGMGCRTRY